MPAPATPASSASRPKASTGPSAPAPRSSPGSGADRAPGEHGAGEVVGVVAFQADRRQRCSGGVGGDRDDEGARSRARGRVGPARRALHEPACRRLDRAAHARQPRRERGRGGDRLDRARRGAEPPQPDARVAQTGMHARQRELLGRADRHGRPAVEGAHVARGALRSRGARRRRRRPASASIPAADARVPPLGCAPPPTK